MKIKITQVFLSLVVVLIVNFASAQNLITSRQSSYFTYIYKLTNSEAKQVYKNETWSISPDYFHTLVDSFPTDSIYTKRLPQGHYLKVFSHKNQLKIDIATIQYFDVVLKNNSRDLNLQVIDSLGNPISDAIVKVKHKKLFYDKKTQCYRITKSNKKGFITVDYKGMQVFVNLSRQYNNSIYKRAYRGVLFKTPLKYVWVPVNYVIHIPIDGVKSIVRLYPVGTINRIVRFSEKSFWWVVSRFNSFYIDDYYNAANKKSSWGYMVFNKPKYLPGDTVKYKAYILNSRGNPIKKEGVVNLYNYQSRQRIVIDTIKPKRKGNYSGEFVLSDSLNLVLDREYSLKIKDRNYNDLFKGYFKYEDYELYSSKLETRVEQHEHFIGDSNVVYLAATDENNLPLLGAKAEISINSVQVEKPFEDYTFIPDILLKDTIDLKTQGETSFTIPDSIFPNANFNYQVNIKLKTAQNDNKRASHKVSYIYFQQKLSADFQNDSVVFHLKNNNEELNANAILLGKDRFGNEIDRKKIEFPYAEKINPYYSSYSVIFKNRKQVFSLSKISSNINCYSTRNYDSLNISVENPRKIPFNYFIYKNNNEIERGFATSLDYTKHTRSKQKFHFSIQYLWGGKISESNYEIPLNKSNFKIEVEQPSIIYPGKETQVKIKVTKSNGKPVKNVDVTAFSLTNKFNYGLPQINVKTKPGKSRKVFNVFHTNNFEKNTEQVLDYDSWNLKASIDTLEYYKFLYPGDSLYLTTVPANDYFTQFAPFYIENGQAKQIYVIYVDNRPVYFSWTSENLPYSFRVTPSKHTVQLRVHNKLITINNIRFAEGEKTILSLSDSCKDENVNFLQLPNRFESRERSLFARYTALYSNTFSEPNAYIKQNWTVYPLNNNRSKIFGPVSNSSMEFNLLDEFTLKFAHESGFNYEFAKDILKMRSYTNRNYLPNYLYGDATVSFTDSVITEVDFKHNWTIYKENQKNRKYQNLKYYTPTQNSLANGMLTIDHSIRLLIPFKNTSYLHTIIQSLNGDGFYRAYKDIPTQIYDLKPGNYQLVLLHWNGQYYKTDTFVIQGNGNNFHKFKSLKNHKSNKEGKYYETMLWDYAYQVPSKEKNVFIQRKSNKEFYNIYNGEGIYISGKISDESGWEIPGVNIMVKGTSTGTISDLNGNYRIKVPWNATLVYSFIGYLQEEVEVNSSATIDITLTEDILSLDEVVVVGYGVQRKRDITGSVVNVKNWGMNTLQGKVAGVEISRLHGVSPNIFIRGASTIANNKPLIIIDGVPFFGNLSTLSKDQIKNIDVLKDESATAIYGSKASNGVIIISTKSGAMQQKSLQQNLEEFGMSNMKNAIRNNFSDYAYWQPQLLTDKNGEVSFTAKFPDDVTRWNTYAIAMQGNKKLAINTASIKSFKPLMARLHTPRFLVEGDTAFAIGDIANYTADTIKLNSKFKINNVEVFDKEREIGKSEIDSLILTTTNTDSIKARYTINTSSNYFDGEERSIPVFKKGLEKTVGQFSILNNDTSITITSSDTLGKTYVSAQTSQLEVLSGDISRLIDYKHACNEQMSSKLKALMAYETLCKFKNEKFTQKRKVQKIIKLLIKNQNEDGCWGWWGKSTTSSWVTLHVLEALQKAHEMKYNVSFNKDWLAKSIVAELNSNIYSYKEIELLTILNKLGVEINYHEFIDSIQLNIDYNLATRLKLILLKQQCAYPYSTSIIDSLKNETLFGSVYFEDKKDEYFNFENGRIQNTILAYKIIRGDSILNEKLLQNVRNYFFEHKQRYALNTYELANLIETILPDLLKEKGALKQTNLMITAERNSKISKFSFDTVFNSVDTLVFEKKGTFPLYLTVYQKYWESNPEKKGGDFDIESFLKNENNVLKAGKQETLTVNLKVKKDARYVMIEIPIPAGCSYANKKSGSTNESHREYFKDRVIIYSKLLKAGNHQFYVDLLPRYNGIYSLNPAKVELMYFPTFNANNNYKRVKIN